MTILKQVEIKFTDRMIFGNFVIQQVYERGDLLDAVKIIINFNEVLSLDGDNND